MDIALCKTYRTLAGLHSPGWPLPGIWESWPGSGRLGFVAGRLDPGPLIGSVQTRSKNVFYAECR